MNNPRVIGVTGNIGSGKSTVAAVFAERGATIIEGDELGRQVVEHSQQFRHWLRDRFGKEIWQGDQLDRAALGRIVFADPEARDELNLAIWPPIRELLGNRVEDVLHSGGIAVVDAAMIYEWEDQERYDVIVCVAVDPDIGAIRAAKRLGISQAEAMDRYRMQIPIEQKITRADHTIRNEGSLDNLRRAASQLWTHLNPA